MVGLELRIEPRSDTKASVCAASLSQPTPPFSLVLLSSQEPKSPSYFLTKLCFITNHLVPFHTALAQASLPC